MTDRISRTNTPPTADPARIPQPEGRGAGSHELETASDDPAILRQVIERARERLAFYESFDRIIGENIRRSGELMLETITLREQAQATEDARIARETATERDRQSERDRTHAMLISLRDELNAFQATTNALAAKIEAALGEFSNPTVATVSVEPDRSNESRESRNESPVALPVPEMPAAAAPSSAPGETAAPSAADEESAPRSGFRPIRATASVTSNPAATPETTTDPQPAKTTRTIDLVVTNITRAATALAFQRELAKLPGITHVETREYAESVLRLSVEITSDDAISDETFATWNGPGKIDVVTRQPTLIALDLTEA